MTNITLPDQFADFINEQVMSGRYSSVSEYLGHLIHDDQKRKAQEKLEALLLEGIQNGDPTEMTRQDWADIRRVAFEEFEGHKSQKTA